MGFPCQVWQMKSAWVYSVQWNSCISIKVAIISHLKGSETRLDSYLQLWMSPLEKKEDTFCFSYTEHIFVILCSCNFLAYHIQVNSEKTIHIFHTVSIKLVFFIKENMKVVMNIHSQLKSRNLLTTFLAKVNSTVTAPCI